MRPVELASDEATTISVLAHIAEEAIRGTNFTVLQPTSPLRDIGLIDLCIETYEGDGTEEHGRQRWFFKSIPRLGPVPNPGIYKVGVASIAGSGAEASRTAVLMGKSQVRDQQ